MGRVDTGPSSCTHVCDGRPNGVRTYGQHPEERDGVRSEKEGEMMLTEGGHIKIHCRNGED